jgi:dsDNA-binding SOS-regulon protein
MTTFEKINESAKYGHEGNAEEIYDLGEINVIDIKKNSIVKVNTADIIKIVNDAMFYMQKKYPYLHLYLNTCKVMYIPTFPSRMCNSMCVDNFNNLWINMNFVYNECAMNKDRVFGILFHEMFHIFLEHLIRFNTMFPKETKALMNPDIWKTANKKANMAMDYEINASMVADGIVSEDFWKTMNGLYKKEYTGKTWEEIYNKYGDKEYTEWLEANGEKISEAEMKILEAIEKAAKVLKDPTATDADKAKANKELQKTIDKILGRDRDADIQDILEEMKDTQLGDIGEIGDKMQDVIDDLYKSPSKMSESQYNDLMEDIDQMADEMAKNASKIADTFKKTEDDVLKDIENMRKTMKDSITQMKENKMSKEDKKDIADKIKDSLEDIISSDIDKKRSEEKRKERDEKKAKDRKEAFKAKHPLRKLINVFKNLMHLGEEPYDLVCTKSYDIMENIVDILDVLTEVNISEITEDDVEDLKLFLSQLKDSLFTDLKKLLDNKIILHKTEDDLHRVLDGVFEVVEKALFTHLLNPDLDDNAKTAVLKTAADKLRIIGKILKTQKAWRASDDFKKGYKEMRDELMSLFKKDKKAVLKRLYDMGVINHGIVNSTFDKRSKELFNELISEGEIK